jgi:homoserine/homoserine lactone efflux protein
VTLVTILLFALTELALSLSPGPAVFLVVSQGMKAGFRGSLRSTLGIMTGELIFFTLSAFGLGALLIASQPLFLCVKWAGASYLVYLGLKMMIRSFRQTDAGSEPTRYSPHGKFYRQGLLMQLANPKAILFFTALLPQFINPGFPATVQFVALGLVSITVQGSTLTAYGWLAEKGGGWLKQSRFSQWLDRFAGLFLIGAGMKLAFTQRLGGLGKS